MSGDFTAFYSAGQFVNKTRDEIYRKLVSGILNKGTGWIRQQIPLLIHYRPLMEKLEAEDTPYELSLIVDSFMESYPIPVERRKVMTAVYTIKAEVARIRHSDHLPPPAHRPPDDERSHVLRRELLAAMRRNHRKNKQYD